jgi:SNF2 family DNA or RNA helicase
VFSQFTGFLALVRQRLDDEGISYSYLDGRTRDRAARIGAFRTGDDPVFLISLKAGGFGLTLTEADYVFILDPWWNPAAEAQAIDRAHRIGQDKPVNVYRLVSADTIEEKVVALADSKRHLFDEVVGATSDMVAPLSADDIRGLLLP